MFVETSGDNKFLVQERCSRRCAKGVVVAVCTMSLVFAATIMLAIAGCSISQQKSSDSSLNKKLMSVSDVRQTASPAESKATLRERSSSSSEENVPLNTSILAVETVISSEELAALNTDDQFVVAPIPDEVFNRMVDVTFPDWCPVPRDELRYLRVLHVDADGNTKIGEMVVHQSIADDVCEILRQLYEARYPIERIRLADDYGGDDEVSMEANNSSAFNCRPIEGTGETSWHSYGLAVDINTLYNPYYYAAQGVVLPTNAWDYIDRSVQTPYTIDRGDLCYQLFIEHGFEWGGDWDFPYDYQHFEKPF